MQLREHAWGARIAIFNPSRAHGARDAEFCQETDFREAPETAGRIKKAHQPHVPEKDGKKD